LGQGGKVKIQIAIAASTLMIGSMAFAKADASAKDALVKKMVTACKAELGKEPGLTDMTDGEKVWRNLEDKEHAKVKLSKNCHNAHEKYEAKYHKDEESEENEHHE
jgi:hypothetical protein